MTLVYFNKLSNLHGISWSRALVFTLVAGLSFYFCYLLTLGTQPFQWGNRNWESFTAAADNTVKYFVRFIIITHDIDFMASYKTTAGSFVVDFLGRILWATVFTKPFRRLENMVRHKYYPPLDSF